MNRYEFLLFGHVAAVVVWLGTGTALALIALVAERAGDRALLAQLGPLGRRLGPRVFGPASLAALVFGILLVLDGPWSFDLLWVTLGLAAFATSLLLTVVVRLPLIRRVERGELDPRRAGRLFALLARIDLAVLYLAVADMVAKPTGGDTWTLAGGGAILALAVASVLAGAARTPQQVAHP